jgi:hypothetical protein
MAPTKGPALEELVRAYFSRQGYFALRSVPFRFEDEDVTDVDVWLYSRQAASVRIRSIVDVKNKKSPKGFERVLWVKGLQQAMRCDRAVVATTEVSPTLTRFAQTHNIAVLSKTFLDKLAKKLDVDERITFEEFVEGVRRYEANKQDGDWLKILGDAKSAVASMAGFPAFNRAMFAFRFFGERAEVRVQHRDAALRCALLTAALACIALDAGLERFVFGDVDQRFDGLTNGVLYGDSGDGKVRASISSALEVVAEGLANGKAIAAQAQDQFDRRMNAVRADIIAEFFMREHNAQHLFSVARELESAAHARSDPTNSQLSLEAKSILGVFADFAGIKRFAFTPPQKPPLMEEWPAARERVVAVTDAPPLEASDQVESHGVESGTAQKRSAAQQKLI